MPYQKSVQQYRRDIFGLKTKLKQQQKYLQQAKQKYSQLDIFNDQKSYSFGVKLKILQYSLVSIKQKMDKYKKDQAYQFYALNYATLALIKASDIFGINREMIFRAVDIQFKGKISALDFSKFLKDTLRLDDEMIMYIVRVLDDQNNGMITRDRYNKYLECFLINSEQQNKQIQTVDQASQRIARQFIFQRNSNPTLKLSPQQIWKSNWKQLNVAIFCRGLVRKIGRVDPLDCVAMYCMLDPNKKGYIQTENAIAYLASRVKDQEGFSQGRGIKLQK